MENVVKQLYLIDKEIQEAKDSSDALVDLLISSTDLNEVVRIGRLLSEAHGEITGLQTAKQIILDNQA